MKFLDCDCYLIILSNDTRPQQLIDVMSAIVRNAIMMVIIYNFSRPPLTHKIRVHYPHNITLCNDYS